MVKENETYLKIATTAAEQERLSQFTFAANLWQQANQHAQSRANRYWSEARADFCTTRHLRN